MIKTVIVIVVICVCVVNSFAQGLSNTYFDLRDKGVSAQKKENYKRAIDCFEGAMGCNVDNTEIQNLCNQLNTVMMETFDTGKKLYEDGKYQEAIIEFNKLEGIDCFISYYLYSYIALSYSGLNNNNLAINVYKKGIENGDDWASYGLACLVTQNNMVLNMDYSLVKLYEMSAQKGIRNAMDSLGSQYESYLRYDKAAEWFNKSESNYGKYHLACFYLEGKINGVPDNQNGIRVLKDIADKGYAPAQYYLGLLYYTGSSGVLLDKVKGWSLIQEASLQGYAPAKDRIAKKGRHVYY